MALSVSSRCGVGHGAAVLERGLAVRSEAGCQVAGGDRELEDRCGPSPAISACSASRASGRGDIGSVAQPVEHLPVQGAEASGG